MKTIIIMCFSIILLISCSSIHDKTKCNSKMEETHMEQLEQNKETALNLSRSIMKGNWDQVDNLISDDFTYEADGRPAIGKDAYIGFMKNVLSNAFTNMDMDFLRVIGEGNLVSVDYTNKMTHVGEFYGIPATQKRIISTGQFIREVKDGKVIAEWQTTNTAGMMQQLTGK